MGPDKAGAQNILVKKSRVTLADVAVAAGVSKMTASRALRAAGDVSKSNVERVLQAAQDIGYVGNPLASSLSGQRSNLVGVVVPSVANVVFAEVLGGIAEGMQGTGMQPVFGVTEYDLDREYNVIRNMLSWNPAGLIVTGLDQSEDARRLLENTEVPVVQIMDLDGTPIDACVGFSQSAAGAEMADALLAMGRRQIGYIGCDLNKDTRANKRLEGFKRTLLKNGLELLVEEITESPSAVSTGRALTARALANRPDLDCIYYSNDDLAAGGAFHCMANGVIVPDTVVLAGFNGLDFIESLPVKIATSRTPRRKIGKTAVKYIVATTKKNGAPQDKVIAYTPIVVD